MIMGRWRSLLPIVGLGLLALAGGHVYLWARLVRDVGLDPALGRALGWILVGLAPSIPVGVVASRMVSPRWSRWWITPIYLWIGVAFLVVLSLVTVDVVRFAYVGLTGSERDFGPRWGAVAALVVGLGASVWAVGRGAGIRVERVEVVLDTLPRALDGLRIVQVSDVHVGPTIGRAFVTRIVDRVNALHPDIVAITGDLVDASVADLEHDVAPLARLQSTYGAYFVTGNHEYHAGAARWCGHLGTLGIRVLRNESVPIEHHGHTLVLAGIDDEEAADHCIGHGADLDAALAGRDPSAPLILMAHQPKAVRAAIRYHVDLQLSGHTHGGQIWPLGRLMRLTQPVVAGLARFGDTWVYVNRGTGHSGPPMRLTAPGEITELILRARS